MPTANTHTIFYAVRTGDKRGIYTNWGDAQDADFQRKQTDRNAGKYKTREEAEEYLLQPPNLEGYMKYAYDLAKILVGGAGFFTAGLVFTYLVWYMVEYADDYFECSSFRNLISPLCASTAKLKYTLRVEALNFLLKGVSVAISSICGGYAVLNGVLPRLIHAIKID